METELSRVQLMLIQIVPFFMAIVFHEFGHGWIAYLWGDKTAKDQGRLTLNPIPHLDPIGTIAIPIFNMLTQIPLLIGWARPVPIDPRQFRKIRPGLFWVAVAGPGMNFLLAILSSLIFVSIVVWVPKDFYLFTPLAGMAQVSVQINFMLAIFNLLPLPPLDGSRIIESILPYRMTQKYEQLSRFSMLILIGLLITGYFGYIIGPPTNFLTHAALGGTEALFQFAGLI